MWPVLSLGLALFASNPNAGVEHYMPYTQIHSTIQAQNVSYEPAQLTSALIEIEIEKKREEAKKPKPVVKAVAPAPKPVTQNVNYHELFVKYASEYGANPSIMIAIAQCESGMRANAINGPYGGMFQFLASTWASNRAAMGLSTDPNLRFSAEEAIKTAAFKMGRDGYGAWPHCSQSAFSTLALGQ